MLHAVIDRFEGQKAVLYIDESEEKIVMPKKYLPIGSKESDCLRFEIARDEEKTRQAAAEAQALLAQVKEMCDTTE